MAYPSHDFMRSKRVNLLKTLRRISCTKEISIRSLLILLMLLVVEVIVLNKYSLNALYVPNTSLGAGNIKVPALGKFLVYCEGDK